jgi:hypothetical protein
MKILKGIYMHRKFRSLHDVSILVGSAMRELDFGDISQEL